MSEQQQLFVTVHLCFVGDTPASILAAEVMRVVTKHCPYSLNSISWNEIAADERDEDD